MKEKNPIDELFKQGLDNKEIKPSDAAWSRIEEAMMPEDSKKGGFYFMRAAVVTLLIGLSSWVYLNNNPIDFNPKSPIPPTTIETGVTKKVKDSTGEPKKAAAKTTTEPKTPPTVKENNSKKATPKSGSAKIIPLIKNTGSTLIKYVSKRPSISPADEDTRMMEYEMFAAEDLIIEEDFPTKRINGRRPVAGDLYADNGQEKENAPKKKLKLRERVFAYASNQFDNLISGDPLELPKTELKGMPKLEISLGKFLTKE